MGAKLEIKLRASWLEVSEYIFRSWARARRKNGKRYRGPVYYLGSDNIYRQEVRS